MPAMCHPIRTTGLRSLPALVVLLMGATLAGCSGGDFGRTRADMRNDDMHRWIGVEATASIGLKSSQFQLTDLTDNGVLDVPLDGTAPPGTVPTKRPTAHALNARTALARLVEGI